MTTDPPRRRARTVSIATDDRARIPFAVIGVLLLVGSVLTVGALQSRPEPNSDIDPSLAIDRTEAATGAAIRAAALRATDRAAEQPVTEAASNPYGAVISNGSAADPDEVFEAYAKALIYLEVQDGLPDAGQEIRDVVTAASIPEVEDDETLAEAIERVHLETVGEGSLRVTIENVTIAADRNGDRLAERTDDVSVTVATPVFELHEKVDEYERQLNAGVTESGFSQRFNARLYALGWARGYAQYYGQPVTEVIANRHVVPSANSGIYRTQQDVFGTTDPNLPDAMRQAWLCMAIQDAENLYGGYGEDDMPEYADAESMCDSLELLYGDQVGDDAPDAPTVQDLMGNAPGMDEEHTIGVNETSYVPLARMSDPDHDHSFGSVVDRIFTVEAESDATADVESWDEPEPEPPGDDWERDREFGLVHEGTSFVDGPAEVELSGDDYYRFEATVDATYNRSVRWRNETGNATEYETTTDEGVATISFAAALSESDHSVDAEIDAENPDVGIDQKYEIGNGTPVAPGDPEVPSVNYWQAPDRAAEAMLGSDPTDAFAEAVEASVTGTDPGDVSDGFGESIPDEERIELDHEAVDGVDVSLEAAIAEDLTAVRADVEDVTHTFPRTDLIHEGDDDGPFDELIAEVEAERAAWLDRDDRYDNVGQKVVYEARWAYFQLLIADLERVADAHGSAMSEFDDQLADANAGLANSMEYLQQGVSAEEPGNATIEAPELVDEDAISYEITGSPTYLVTENVTNERVPAVDRGVQHAPMAATNENFFSIPYDTIVESVFGAIGDVLGFDEDDAEVTLKVAGEALRAAERTEAITGNELPNHDSLETEVTGAVSKAKLRTSIRVTSRLELEADEWSPIGLYNESAYGAVEAGIDDAATEHADVGLPEPGVAVRAIALGEGTAAEPTASAVADALAEHRPSEYDPDVWELKAETTTRRVVTEVTAETMVTLDDVETVEHLDEAVRDELKDVTTDVIEARTNDSEFVLDDEEEWAATIDGHDAPKRVPAGLPITPVPGYWYATANVWDVDVAGEYARFEVTANVGTPATAGGTTYVRENGNATVEVGGEERLLGTTEPVRFDGRSVVFVVVPPGGIGVGDRTGVRTECSDTWPVSGPIVPDDPDEDDPLGGGGDDPWTSDPGDVDPCADEDDPVLIGED